jgi:hypothetical protein
MFESLKKKHDFCKIAKLQNCKIANYKNEFLNSSVVIIGVVVIWICIYIYVTINKELFFNFLKKCKINNVCHPTSIYTFVKVP